MTYYCRAHPTYRGKRPPTGRCCACWSVYLEKLDEVGRIRRSAVRTTGTKYVVEIEIIPKPPKKARKR